MVFVPIRFFIVNPQNLVNPFSNLIKGFCHVQGPIQSLPPPNRTPDSARCRSCVGRMIFLTTKVEVYPNSKNGKNGKTGKTVKTIKTVNTVKTVRTIKPVNWSKRSKR